MKECPYETMPERPSNFPIGMAYVPWQRNADTYEHLEDGLCNGTVFPELYKPFTGRRCVR